MDMATDMATVTMNDSRNVTTGKRAGRVVAAVSGCAMFCAFPVTAWAGDWELTDSVTAKTTAIDRNGANESSGLVFEVKPQIKLKGEGARSKADIDYQLTLATGTGDTDPETMSHRLRAQGEVEAIEDFFFLGANAGARLVGRDATSGPVDAINARSDGTQSYSVGLTPRFRHRLNKYADIVSDNEIDYVTYDRNGSEGNTDDSYSTRLHLGVRSGHAYGPLNWRADASHRTTEYEDSDSENTTYSVGAGYRFNVNWEVNGSVGYEENDVDTRRSDTDGVIWDVGATWTPNSRTSMSASYGQRYFGDTFSGRISHETRRTQFVVDLSRTVASRRAFELVNFGLRGVVDDEGNPFIGANGEQVMLNVFGIDETDEEFINTQLRGAMTMKGVRTTVTVTGTVSKREYEISPIEEDTYGLSVFARRQLSSNYTATVNGGFTHAEGSANSDSDTFDIGMSVSRRLTPRTSASVDVLYRERDASDADNSYDESRIGVSLKSSFL